MIILVKLFSLVKNYGYVAIAAIHLISAIGKKIK